ncbi:hypothetical protein G7B40_033210 [Aetokthonos hydrillicola Thurmond2011]|jgi:hypothetical protein|uniref:Uncharacterized protein n=1 Tax=Aetokthonos hydrillicola Thurmond2011 TaxID=2712845 RepID=A0AAP5IH74_9CYAN|nr:hypothetical protein [Aetokthonos hydrillicola]MBO3459579.1 hypothetical protein [Aetokthonos hydrillicola CCALA 1050]MBW4590945.1 hypothetical protein [Aetokthonos hydrillicola CCALA 1050]MDR9899385.1 hypothetical protein [Aetokthonos hydrillicola Thurmond2011]
MNIIEQTSTTLKFQDNNWQWLWGLLFSIPFVAIGLGIPLVTSNVTTLECQRTKPSTITCQRTIIGLSGTETTVIPGQIKGANVALEHGTGVVLDTSNIQSVELVNHRVFIRDKQYQIADEINTFIKNHQQSRLKVQQDDRWEGFFEGMVLFLPGIAIILQSLTIPKQIRCDFDKISQQMTLEKHYQFLGRFTTQKKLTEVKQAQVTQIPIETRIPRYFVQLELTSAKPISLSPITYNRQECETIANAINQFLRLMR